MTGSARVSPWENGALGELLPGHLVSAVTTDDEPQVGRIAAAHECALGGDGASVGLTIHLPAQEKPNAHLTVHVPFHNFFFRKLAFVKYP